MPRLAASAAVAVIATFGLTACGEDDPVETRTGASSETTTAADTSDAAASPPETAVPRSNPATLRCPPGDRVFGTSALYADDPNVGAETPEQAADLFFSRPPAPPDRSKATEYRYNEHPRRAEISYDLDGRTMLIAGVEQTAAGRWIVGTVQACNSFMYPEGQG